MTLLLQSADWIRNTALARLRGSRDLTGLATEERTPIWRLVNAFAQEVRKVVVDFVAYSVNIIPTTSTGIWLQRWMTAFGLTPILESKWTGFVGLQASGAATPAFAAGLQLTFAGDGTIYQTTDAVLAGDWAGGACTKAAESVTLGTTANKDSGTALVVTAPPAGLLATATLGATTTAAADDETETAQKVRLGNRIAGMPAAGNCAHYRQWVLDHIAAEIPIGGVGAEAVDCAVYPRWDDAGAVHGTVTVALFGPVLPFATELEVSAACVASHQAYIDAIKPVGSTVTVESVDLVGNNVFVTLNPRPGYGADWPRPGAGFDILSNVVGSRRVNLDLDPTGIILPGQRVVLPCSVLNITEQEYVESVGASYIILREWPENGDPHVGEEVMPGGPLWQPVYDAIIGVFDSLGPLTSNTAGKDRYPVEEVERPSTLFLGDLYEAVEAIEGVCSCVWTNPNANVGNADVAGHVIHMLGPNVNIQIDYV